MTESWFPIKRYRGKYQVSDQGNVRNATTLQPVHERRTKAGERQARLSYGGHDCHWTPVKNLVAEELAGITLASGNVVHIDGDPANCSRGNLYLDTGVGTPIPGFREKEQCSRGHLLTSWNLTTDGRCRTCKSTRSAMRRNPGRFDDSEYERRYRSFMPLSHLVEEPPVPEFFDRRGIGVYDVYTSF